MQFVNLLHKGTMSTSFLLEKVPPWHRREEDEHSFDTFKVFLNKDIFAGVSVYVGINADALGEAVKTQTIKGSSSYNI